MSLTDEILFGTLGSVERVLHQGADVNEIDVYGFTPLIEATIVNDTEKAEFLIKHGANVNQHDVTGRTPLHWAADIHNVSLSTLLLENKADPNAYTEGGQPVLVYPLLRNQQNLKKLLYQHRADLNFAQDYINGKLLGHRFQLLGQVDIVNSKGHFIELDFEGFFLEFTLAIVENSLARYRNNFAARKLRPYFNYINKILDRYLNATELLKYQSYLIDIDEHAQKIDALLKNELLLLPVAYRGHAVTFIKHGNLLARVDRGENSKIEGTVVIYKITKPQIFNAEFMKKLIYKPQTIEFITSGIKRVLGLTTLFTLPLTAQIIGNCSWANVEGAIPTMIFLLMLKEQKRFGKSDIAQCKDAALSFYNQWQEWDQDRALEDCVKSFDNSNPARKATKATILAAILFQQCNYHNPKDIERAEKILPILMLPEYQYILKSYIEIYWKSRKTRAGHNLIQVLEFCGVKIS